MKRAKRRHEGKRPGKGKRGGERGEREGTHTYTHTHTHTEGTDRASSASGAGWEEEDAKYPDALLAQHCDSWPAVSAT